MTKSEIFLKTVKCLKKKVKFLHEKVFCFRKNCCVYIENY